MGRNRNIVLLVQLLCRAALLAHAATPPEWLRTVAASTIRTYEPRTEAVVLLDETRVIVNPRAEIKVYCKIAYKILNTDGRRFGTLHVPFRATTRIKKVHGWTIPRSGDAFELGEKASVDVGGGEGDLYSDQGTKSLQMPGAEPGSIVGFEYELENTPEQLQFFWFFQRTIPVQRSSFELTVPPGWKIKSLWQNQKALEARLSGNTYSWEVSDVPAIEVVDRMPSWRAVAGHMAASVVPDSATLKGRSYSTWGELATWYQDVVAERSKPNEKVDALARSLITNSTDWLGKLSALARYAQSKVRYVAIEIGKGGYEPHFPEEVLLYNYGDCKDKALLLSAMLQAVGIRSYLVLASTERDTITDDFPSMASFNHAILAIQVPVDIDLAKAYAFVSYSGGRLLLFDPTDAHTPVGQLPDYLQGNRVLLAAPGISAPTQLPLPKPEANALVRKANIKVGPDGGITGEVEERRSGSIARGLRRSMLAESSNGQRQYVERFLDLFLNGANLQSYNFANLEDDEADLILRYKFEASGYVRHSAGITVMRARVLGQKAEIVFETDRKYPLELDVPTLQTDEFDITLPSGESVAEAPDPTDLHNDFAEYTSRTETQNSLARYSRAYRIKNVFVPVEHLKEMKSFYRSVASDERANIVLKGTP